MRKRGKEIKRNSGKEENWIRGKKERRKIFYIFILLILLNLVNLVNLKKLIKLVKLVKLLQLVKPCKIGKTCKVCKTCKAKTLQQPERRRRSGCCLLELRRPTIP